MAPPPPMPPAQDPAGGMDGTQPPAAPPIDGPDMGGEMPEGDMGEMDPKKEIQQQTGALSQALNQYNMEQEKPDTELNKYVMNMLAKQAGKAMTPKDKKSVIKKLNSPDDTAEDMEDETEMSMDDGGTDNGMAMESRRVSRIVDEVIGDMLGGERLKRKKRVISNDKIGDGNPFLNGLC